MAKPTTAQNFAMPTASPHAALTDAELVDGIRNGNDRLTSELYRRYNDKVFYRCLSMTKDRELAHDLAQDVFVKVLTNLPKFKGTSDFSFWIYAITYNHCISYLRKNKRLRFEELDEDAEKPDTGNEELHAKVLQELRLSHLQLLLKQLKASEQTLLLMRYRDGISVQQIAELLGLGESAVKMRLLRSRGRLNELLLAMREEE